MTITVNNVENGIEKPNKYNDNKTNSQLECPSLAHVSDIELRR